MASLNIQQSLKYQSKAKNTINNANNANNNNGILKKNNNNIHFNFNNNNNDNNNDSYDFTQLLKKSNTN